MTTPRYKAGAFSLVRVWVDFPTTYQHKFWLQLIARIQRMREWFQTLSKSSAELAERWQAAQPLPVEHERRLWQRLRIEWNYNSNHIEGNTLTYGETLLLLIHGRTRGDHLMREYEEMRGHDVAIEQDLASLFFRPSRSVSASIFKQQITSSTTPECGIPRKRIKLLIALIALGKRKTSMFIAH